FERWIPRTLTLLILLGSAALDRGQQLVSIELVLVIVFDIPALGELEENRKLLICRNEQANFLAAGRLALCLHECARAFPIDEHETGGHVNLRNALQPCLRGPLNDIEFWARIRFLGVRGGNSQREAQGR